MIEAHERPTTILAVFRCGNPHPASMHTTMVDASSGMHGTNRLKTNSVTLSSAWAP